MLKADLHIHTTTSDGVFTPSKVVLRAKEKGLQLIAVTDHDAIGGIAQAKKCAADQGIQVLSGVELSCGGSAEIHVLGYGFDENNQILHEFLQNMRDERKSRADKILHKLDQIGFPVNLPETDDTTAVGRPMIARAMMARGYVSSVQEAFDRYLNRGCPAYVARQELDVCKAITLLRSLGAVPVLAHPSLIKLPPEEINIRFREWIDAGLMGIEIYHPAMYECHKALWEKTARENCMLITGGSDFHAIGDSHADIGAITRYWNNCSEDAEKLLNAIDQLKN